VISQLCFQLSIFAMPVGTRATSQPLSDCEISASGVASSSRNAHNRQGRGGKRRGTVSDANRRPAKRTVRIEEPSERSQAAEEAAHLRARILELERERDTLDSERQKRAADEERERQEKQAKKKEYKERKQATIRERTGLDIKLRSPRTSEIAREDADSASRLVEVISSDEENDIGDDYNIVLTGAVVINRRNEGKKPFATQKRSSFEVSELERWATECVESGSITGGLRLEDSEYSTQRRRVYVYSTAKSARKEDFDIDDFSISQVDLILDRADTLRRAHPKGDISILIEVTFSYDRKAVEKARKEAENRTNPPPATLAESSRSRGRAGAISTELRNQLDGDEYARIEEKIKSHWTCTSASCPHVNKLCWVSPERVHYAFGYIELNI
jgi:hypothetical protein